MAMAVGAEETQSGRAGTPKGKTRPSTVTQRWKKRRVRGVRAVGAAGEDREGEPRGWAGRGGCPPQCLPGGDARWGQMAGDSAAEGPGSPLLCPAPLWALGPHGRLLQTAPPHTAGLIRGWAVDNPQPGSQRILSWTRTRPHPEGWLWGHPINMAVLRVALESSCAAEGKRLSARLLSGAQGQE